VLAERQTCGRGRGANRWWSADGALTFSLVLDATSMAPSAERLPQVSLTAALAVCEGLQQSEPTLDAGLKWPNDVYVQGRKICGILIEVPSRPTGRMVVGVGVNVNNSLADAPEELRDTATSLCDVSGKNSDLSEVLIAILRAFSGHLELLVAGPSSLSEKWQELSVLTGRTICLSVDREEIRGVCRGIDAEGALLLKTDQRVQRFFTGVIVEFDNIV
jgi:BirA family biotin operon repressor/biotin-[acetyl-CoA-carboxylase] ligase